MHIHVLHESLKVDVNFSSYKCKPVCTCAFNFCSRKMQKASVLFVKKHVYKFPIIIYKTWCLFKGQLPLLHYIMEPSGQTLGSINLSACSMMGRSLCSVVMTHLMGHKYVV